MPHKAAPKIDEHIRSLLKKMEDIKDAGSKDFLNTVDEIRRQVILAIVQNGDLSPNTRLSLKITVEDVIKRFTPKLQEQLSENQRRLFVKGIQLVDNVAKNVGITIAIPYLSEKLLEQVKNLGGELITGLTDDMRKRIVSEIDLGVLGQKPIGDVIASIGGTLPIGSVFGTVEKRAEVIYRTEVTRVANLATIARLKQAKGQVPDLQKEWLHSHMGSPPRAGHLDLDGTIIGLDEKFSLVGADGETYEVNAPHDAILPAGDVINCRCVAIPHISRFDKETQ